MRHVNRDLPRTVRGGFSMVEALVSLVLFLTVAAFITWSMTAAYAARSSARARADQSALISANLDSLTQTPVVDLLAGTFTVPSPCPGTPDGIGGRSCVQAGAVTVTVAYRFVDPANPAPCLAASADPGAVLDATGVVQIQACTTGAAPSAFTAAPSSGAPGVPAQTRTVLPADPGYVRSGRRVVVHLAGTWSALGQRPVYLLTAADPTRAVASAVVGSDGTVTLAVPDVSTQAVCTINAPCIVGLSPTATPTVTTDTPTLLLTDTTGALAGISVADNATAMVYAQVSTP